MQRPSAPLALVALVLIAQQGGMQAAAFDPARIVPNINDCPVANVRFPPSQFSTDVLITVFAPLAQSIPNQECATQATSLAVCAFDESLGVQTGCCSTGCAAQLKKVNDLNCFPALLAIICQANPEQLTQIQPFMPVLTSLAANCINYPSPPAINCPDGRTISTGAAGAAGMMGGEAMGGAAAEAPAPEMGVAGAGLPGAAATPAPVGV